MDKCGQKAEGFHAFIAVDVDRVKQINRYTDKQINRQTDLQTKRQTDVDGVKKIKNRILFLFVETFKFLHYILKGINNMFKTMYIKAQIFTRRKSRLLIKQLLVRCIAYKKLFHNRTYS